jgi:type IV pilus assembly protein PilN
VIRTNLSTRPFYNEQAVHAWLIAIALSVAAATVFNVSRVIRYSRSDTQLAMQASRDESRAADLRQQASRLRATVDPRQIEFASSEARMANDLIDRRTFSWTELFNRFEATLPDEVRIAAVRPKVDRKNGNILTINVVGRTIEDVDRFMENLEATGAFSHTESKEERINDEGLLAAAIETTYVPTAAKDDATGGAGKP